MDNSQLYHQWFGIPPKDQPPNAYRLLGVELFETDPLVIEAAAEQRMLLLRARQTGSHSAQSQQMMNEVAKALRILLCDDKRADYDTELRRSQAVQGSTGQEASLVAEEIPGEEIDEIHDSPAPRVGISIQTQAVPALRQRRRQKAVPISLWVGVAGGALIGLVVLNALFMRNGGESPKIADKPPAKPPHKTLRPAVAGSRSEPILAVEVPGPNESQFRPSEQAAEPKEESNGALDEGQPEPAVATDPAPEGPPTRTTVVVAEAPITDEPIPAPSDDTATPSPGKEGEKKLLQPDDLRFIGAFKLPQKACGQSTGYAAGCLALRHVNKLPRLFSDSHVGTGGAVYEVDVPELAKKPPYVSAEIVREWGDIYKGHKRKAKGESYNLDGEVPTTGLRWDEAGQRMWWIYGQKYNTENQDAPTFGFTKFDGDQLSVEGPWRLNVPQSWQRGGTLEIPAWFADKYTGGKRLGVGFGGYYSIFEGGSYGPTLSAASEPAAGKSPSFVTLLAYPKAHPCERNANYQHVAEGWMGSNPVNGRGTWNATDEIGGEVGSGGAVWIDAADKHGLLFFASLGTGRIAYENGGVQCAGRENALFIYDPADLAKVAQKKAQTWTPTPKFYPLKNPAPGMEGRAAGVAWHSASRRLYVVFVNAYIEGEEGYPLVVVYQI